MSQSRDNRLMPMLPSPTPIQSMPYSARQPDQAVRFGDEPAPTQNSALWAQAAPMTNSAPVPAQSSNLDDIMAKFRRELDQMAYDRFGVMPKRRIYTKPYPEYFDLQPYPPGYRVPEFSKFNGVDN